MKMLKTSFLVFGLMLAGSVSLFAQTAEEVVKKHMDAIGGEEAWKKVNAMKMTGSMSIQGMEIPVDLTFVQKKAMRMDMTLMGMANYTIVTDKEGWAYFPAQGQTKAQPFTADQVKESQSQLDIQGELVDYKAKGSKIEFLGKDDMDGTETVKIKLTEKDGQEKTMYFDAASYYLLKEVQKVQADGKEDEVVTGFSNFQKLPEGITVPMTVESPMGPITMKSIEVNPKIDEAIFKPAN